MKIMGSSREVFSKSYSKAYFTDRRHRLEILVLLGVHSWFWNQLGVEQGDCRPLRFGME